MKRENSKSLVRAKNSLKIYLHHSYQELSFQYSTLQIPTALMALTGGQLPQGTEGGM